MVVSRWGWVISTVLLGSGTGFVASEARAQAKPDAPPVLEGPLVGEPTLPPPPAEAPEPEAAQAGELETTNAPLHDALRLTETRSKPERAPKSPPAPVAERPSTDRPAPSARWFGGYWSWDPARNDFDWVSGAWRVPPANSIWVESRWMRDADGWYRVPGFWSPRQQGRAGRDAAPAPAAALAPATETAAANAPGWRISGPPADRPAESPGPAPGPDFFYIPGQYTPDGDRAVWKSGFWAQVQPGWDWVSARWSRQADGWHYRAGYWTRDTGPGLSDIRRHAVARPGELPPAIIESEPATATDPNAGLDDLPPSDGGRDLLSEAEQEAADRALDPAPPIVVVTPRGRYGPVGPPIVDYRYRMPYRMIRPPSPLYGPAGVVVPDAVPPFVQRLLNRVLP
ncbi:hypothetical protein SAMN05444166_0402 [Singulisphaera sp. GP187]|uniref:hypothetical protein n=1 Tax=Singulisphaera sp. GP187 TaxID=1882752 RepID=UPI000928DFF7|nr:hypothetical protein [Singulisphaera sp. GP187]SIN71886.1 hypothetical protein SAMN05444166_0402 [Singulisphaera sp. GP187]